MKHTCAWRLCPVEKVSEGGCRRKRGDRPPGRRRMGGSGGWDCRPLCHVQKVIEGGLSPQKEGHPPCRRWMRREGVGGGVVIPRSKCRGGGGAGEREERDL